MHLLLSAHPMNILSQCLQKPFAYLHFKAPKYNFLTKQKVVIEVVSVAGVRSLKVYNQKILQLSYPNYLKKIYLKMLGVYWITII